MLFFKFLKATSYKLKARRGFGLVEILIASAIITVAFTTLAGVLQSAFRVTEGDVQKIQAEFLAQEGIEAVRILRDKSFKTYLAPLARETPYYPIFNATLRSWSLGSSDPGRIDGVFRRSITLENVYRNVSDDDIVPLAGAEPKILDSGTIKITSRVSWKRGEDEREVALETYITDLFGN